MYILSYAYAGAVRILGKAMQGEDWPIIKLVQELKGYCWVMGTYAVHRDGVDVDVGAGTVRVN